MLPADAADPVRFPWSSGMILASHVAVRGSDPRGTDTFLNAIGELFSIAVGFRSGKVRVG